MTNDSVERYIEDMELDMNAVHQFFDMDFRTWLDTALGVKYFVIKDIPGAEKYLPYGYSQLVKIENDYRVYESEYALPLVYSFDSYIPGSVFDDMTAIQKQQAVLQGLVLSDEEKLDDAVWNFPCTEIQMREFSSPYEIVYGDGISVEGNRLIVSKQDAVMIIKADSVSDCERYIWFDNLAYSGGNKADVTVSGSGISNSFQVMTPKNSFFTGVHSTLLNLGYADISEEEYAVCFHTKGIYSFEQLQIWNLSMEDFVLITDKLKSDGVNYELGDNLIQADIVAEDDRLVYFAVPYSTGWRAEIDGMDTEIYRANDLGMGIPVKAGEHHITLRYCTPYLKISIWIAGAGLLGLVIYWQHGRKMRYSCLKKQLGRCEKECQ